MSQYRQVELKHRKMKTNIINHSMYCTYMWLDTLETSQRYLKVMTKK